jgi:hypothetical protein
MGGGKKNLGSEPGLSLYRANAGAHCDGDEERIGTNALCPWSSKKNTMVQSDYLVLGQEGAGAGAHLAHEAFPGVVIRHHWLLHAAFRLKPQKRKGSSVSASGTSSPPRKASAAAAERPTRESMRERNPTHQVDEMVALGVREEAAVEERPARAHTPSLSGTRRMWNHRPRAQP